MIDNSFTNVYNVCLKGVIFLPQTMVNFRMDNEVKKSMEEACKGMGISMSAAFSMFATKVARERRIPFEITADPDPFYSEANMVRLRKAIADAKEGKNMTAHELIEVDDD
jgi:DNA-damage-inducible protein J